MSTPEAHPLPEPLAKDRIVRSALGYAAVLTHVQAWLIWHEAPGRECGAIALLQGSCLVAAFVRTVAG